MIIYSFLYASLKCEYFTNESKYYYNFELSSAAHCSVFSTVTIVTRTVFDIAKLLAMVYGLWFSIDHDYEPEAKFKNKKQ